MIQTSEIHCDLNDKLVVASHVPGTECLHAIQNKCIGCKAAQLSREPRAFEVNQSTVFICKPVEDLYLDEQLAVAVVFNDPLEVVKTLIKLVYNNEIRRSIRMFGDYFEPTTITHLRETGVYPYPRQEGAKSVEEALRRHEELPRHKNTR